MLHILFLITDHAPDCIPICIYFMHLGTSRKGLEFIMDIQS